MIPYLKCEFNVSVKIQQKKYAKLIFLVRSIVENQAEFDLQLKLFVRIS